MNPWVQGGISGEGWITDALRVLVIITALRICWSLIYLHRDLLPVMDAYDIFGRLGIAAFFGWLAASTFLFLINAWPAVRLAPTVALLVLISIGLHRDEMRKRRQKGK